MISRLILRLSLALGGISLANCSSPDSARTTPTGIDSGAAGGPARGALGGPCDQDTDCPRGDRCLPPINAQSAAKYCASACSSDSDCKTFADTSYASISVPAQVFSQGGTPGNNAWGGATELSRGYACAPIGGGQGSGFCQFGCPEYAAVAADGKSCACLPHYSINAGKTACEYDASIQCAILEKNGKNPCDACNSDFSFTDQLSCHSGIFGCNYEYSDFTGECAEYLPMSVFNQCVAASQGITVNCNQQCIDNCDLDETCFEGCCTTTPGPSSPKPVCPSGTGGAN
jgi:hypothetical protein